MKKASAANTSDHRHHPTTNSSSAGWPSQVGKTRKDHIARKVIEKNRRNHMKTLCTHLTSLLPENPSKVPPPPSISFPVFSAIDHLTRLDFLTCTGDPAAAASRSPVMEIRELGSTLEVVVLTGLDQRFIMYQVIRILQQETVEVLNANLSVTGNTIFHTIHGKIEESMYCFRATTIREKLNKLVGFGMAAHDQESDKEAAGQKEQEEEEQGLWDNEILFGNWDFTFGI